MSTLWASDRVVLGPDRAGFRMFPWESQCLQGLECSSSPTSGTAYPLVRGVFALTCDKACGGVPLTLGSRAVAWPPRWPIQVCGVAGSGALASGPSACCGLGYAVPRSGSVGLVGGGQHLFMVRGCGHNMTSPTFIRNFLRGSSGRSGRCRRLFVLPKGLLTLSTLISALRRCRYCRLIEANCYDVCRGRACPVGAQRCFADRRLDRG